MLWSFSLQNAAVAFTMQNTLCRTINFPHGICSLNAQVLLNKIATIFWKHFPWWWCESRLSDWEVSPCQRQRVSSMSVSLIFMIITLGNIILWHVWHVCYWQKKHVDHNSFPTIKWLTQDFPPQFNINKLSFNGDQDFMVFLFHCVMVLEAGK